MPKKKEPKKILIIEDETLLQASLVEMLTMKGYEVKGCDNASSAFSVINDEKPDLILTDLVMQKMDGFEVIETLQNNPDLKDIPVVVISNLNERKNIERAKSLGASDYIVKADTSLETIVKKVNKLLG